MGVKNKIIYICSFPVEYRGVGYQITSYVWFCAEFYSHMKCCFIFVSNVVLQEVYCNLLGIPSFRYIYVYFQS
jgi:hypothetical protein